MHMVRHALQPCGQVRCKSLLFIGVIIIARQIKAAEVGQCAAVLHPGSEGLTMSVTWHT